VGLLYNTTAPLLLRHAPSLVQAIAAMPDRLWFDLGSDPAGIAAAGGRRFHAAQGAIDELASFAGSRVLAAHGLGLSLPSAMPLDDAMLTEAAAIGAQLGGFAWYSEHLSLFVTPKGSVPNAQAGLGLPVLHDDECFAIVIAKLARMQAALRCPLLLENGAFFTPVPDAPGTEAGFLNRLWQGGHCGTLLDLHNLHANERNGLGRAEDYLGELDLDAVLEVHLAGGDDDAGFYMDSHAAVSPPEVSELAHAWLPRCRNLRAITFEYQESYHDAIGLQALVAELERMHELADRCAGADAMHPRWRSAHEAGDARFAALDDELDELAERRPRQPAHADAR
jgi:uncharacterized protein (UPF0276 family)